MTRGTGPTPIRGLIPPRPNLGPEPWPEGPAWAPVVILGLGALACLLALALWRRKARRAERGRAGRDGGASPVEPRELSPRDRLIAAAEAVRSAIVSARGPAWASKTTEELAADSSLAERLGDELAGRLIDFFRISDRVKFAGEEPEGVEAWEEWADHFLETWSAGK